MNVELINTPTEITDESLKQYLADISSVVRNKQPKDNDRLFQRLIKESYGNKPSRVFEYIPCTISALKEHFNYQMQFFGHWHNDYQEYYTNARELLNWGWSWEEVIKVVDFTHYKAVKCTAPYFIYGQVSTHTQITSVSHSNRYTESDLGYWMPEELSNSRMTISGWNHRVKSTPPDILENIMRSSGITRREVYARGSDMLQYRVFSLGGYTNNPNAWQHFVNQRLHDAHTQLETRQLTQMISDAIGVK